MPKLRTVCTCSACPEQYDVFYGEQRVGYLRYRGGTFTAEYPDCGGEVVFAVEYGDNLSGWGLPQRFIDAALEAIESAMERDARC